MSSKTKNAHAKAYNDNTVQGKMCKLFKSEKMGGKSLP